LSLPVLVFFTVKDVSFTLSFAEYTWWDDQSGLENGTLLGAGLWFFGEYVELRASTYSR
jgi:hypothetical protein